ncbi:hypothetical protein V8C86DRAFT_1140072 [Haematococcus lacustris]
MCWLVSLTTHVVAASLHQYISQLNQQWHHHWHQQCTTQSSNNSDHKLYVSQNARHQAQLCFIGILLAVQLASVTTSALAGMQVQKYSDALACLPRPSGRIAVRLRRRTCSNFTEILVAGFIFDAAYIILL